MPAFFGPAGSDSGSFDEFIARFLQGQHPGRQSSPVDINRLLSKRTHDIIANAAKFAVERGQTEVDALHILRVMLSEDPAAAGARQAASLMYSTSHTCPSGSVTAAPCMSSPCGPSVAT